MYDLEKKNTIKLVITKNFDIVKLADFSTTPYSLSLTVQNHNSCI